MQEVTLTKAEMDLLYAGGNRIKVIVSLRKRTGVGLRGAMDIVDRAMTQKPMGKPPVAPPVQAPVARKPVTPSPELMKAFGILLTEGGTKPPVAQKPMEKPKPRLLFRAKAGKHNPRVSLSEVEAMTRGEAEKGALAEAIASVTRWGIPLTIQLNTKDRKGHKGSGRRVRISRE